MAKPEFQQMQPNLDDVQEIGNHASRLVVLEHSFRVKNNFLGWLAIIIMAKI